MKLTSILKTLKLVKVVLNLLFMVQPEMFPNKNFDNSNNSKA